MSQNDAILNMLKRGPVTVLDAEKENIHRLSARIHDLRDKGHKIGSDLVKGKGKGVWYSEYSLEVK